MIRLSTLCPAVALVCVVAISAPAYAQLGARVQPVTRIAALAQSDLHGIVVDERGRPVAGAVVSALGAASAFAVSGPDGRFIFRNLAAGPYLVRAHLQGYLPARGRIIQVTPASHEISTIALTRRAEDAEVPAVLAAGIGPADVPTATSGERDADDDHGEVAWRLRHLKRGVLKSVTAGAIDLGNGLSVDDDPLAAFTRAAATSARIATSLFADLPVNGQFNLLTRTSLDRPQDLFAADTWLPRGIAYLALQSPTSGGEWSMRGAMTQGDLSSWIVAGSYLRSGSASHQYEGGLSYGMQRYLGGNVDALASMSDGSRNVGAVHAYDNWRIAPRVSVSYGAKYARYDYLADRGQFSPRASVTIEPTDSHALKVRALVSRRALAPGAEEFLPPATGLWLPPERTFSPVSPRRGFTPEQVTHVEVGAEREWGGDFVVAARAFRQAVDDQLITVFGVAVPGTAAASVGHYYVASGGDFDARGWGMGVSRSVGDGLRASVEYTQVDARWQRPSPDEAVLVGVAGSVLRRGHDRFHDVTTSIQSVMPVTATRMFIIYKVNPRVADEPSSTARAGARFDVQVNQSLPFLQFSSAQWEMLVAVRNLFREDMVDASVYDELLVMRPPKRVVGGVTVRF
jgi:hypothetical protein